MSAARDSPSSVVRCATIKQAKAAYKARGRPTLSEAEQRQLERNVKLDQRAWAIREREKKRAETAKKRVEKEHEERKKQAGLLGSQRRCDRFGHKSSQFHLGAFFAAGANHSRPGSDAGSMSPATSRYNSADDDEAFGDDGVDDDDLLSAMDTTNYVQPGHQSARNATVSTAQGRASLAPQSISNAKRPAPTSPRPVSVAKHPAPAHPFSLGREKYTEVASGVGLLGVGAGKKAAPMPSVDEDLTLFLDDLGSGTQIARELDADDQPLANNEFVSSFGSADFDFTMDDLEAIESPIKPAPKAQKTPTIMPPPRLPASARDRAKPVVSGPTTMGPPPPPSRGALQSVPAPTTGQSRMPPPPVAKPAAPASRFKKPLPAPFRSASEMWTGPAPTKAPSPFISNSNVRKPMPPPRMPAKANIVRPGPSIPPRRPPPALSLAMKTGAHNAPPVPCTTKKHVSPSDSGITMSQLERCVEDDFQLTQA